MAVVRRMPREVVRALEMPGGYTLGAQGLEVRGFPSLEQHEAVGLFIDRVNEAGGWWKADWLDYAETRADWKDQVEEMAPPATRNQYRYIRKAFPPSKRIRGVTFSHHAAVVNFEPALREKVLQTAATENWTTRETLQAAKHAAQHTQTVLQGQAAGVFDIEVTVLVTIEEETAGAAERVAWAYLKEFLTQHGLPPKALKAKVLLARARSKPEEK
jgi:hypothetical protein